jgi:hypothetical protein
MNLNPFLSSPVINHAPKCVYFENLATLMERFPDKLALLAQQYSQLQRPLALEGLEKERNLSRNS